MNPTNVINPTPKDKFLLHPNLISPHRDMMQNSSLDFAIDIALLQYQRQLCDQRFTEGNMSAISYWRMLGAHEFISILKHLGETAELPPKPTGKNDLNYQS